MHEVEIREADITHLPVIAALAYEIWPIAYRNVISGEQITYMLSEMYTEQALKKQMQDLGHRFLLLFYGGKPAGFVSFAPETEGTWKIHKLYVLPTLQGRNLGKTLLLKAEEAIFKAAGAKVILNVNRKNPAVGFYNACGYSILLQTDIPLGPYILNDFIMEKPLRSGHSPG